MQARKSTCTTTTQSTHRAHMPAPHFNSPILQYIYVYIFYIPYVPLTASVHTQMQTHILSSMSIKLKITTMLSSNYVFRRTNDMPQRICVQQLISRWNIWGNRNLMFHEILISIKYLMFQHCFSTSQN